MSVAVLSLTVAPTAIPAQAAYIPPNVTATLVTANPADNTPHLQNGSMRAFAQIGNTVYAGGSFTGVKNAGATAWRAASYLVAYDATTGVLKTGFAPTFDNAVQTLAVSPDGKLIAGGNFGNVNGAVHKGLVKLDPTTGATVAGWVGQADGGVVRRAIVKGNLLYIAGAFHFINGTAHGLLARLNATTGAIDPSFSIDASVARPGKNSTELVWGLAVSPDGKTVVAVGDFTKVEALSRNQVVVIDVSGTPTVANWSTDRYVDPCYTSSFPFYARDVDFSDDGSYFVIGADGGRGDAYCDSIARFETADRGAVTATWVDKTGTDSVTSLEVVDGVVYVAGHFRWLNNANGDDSLGPGGVDRYGFGALEASNGMPMAWNPTRSPGTQLPAGGVAWAPIVWEVWKGPSGLYIGQDSDGVGNEYHGREAFFPTAGGRTIPAVDAPAATSGYLYLGAGDGHLTKVAFNGSNLAAPAVTNQPNLTEAKAAFSLGNRLYWAKPVSSAAAGSVLEVSIFSGGSVGVPWEGSGFNTKWFAAGSMSGAFYRQGRMYYTVPSANALYYRYLTNDGSIVGATNFALTTTGIDWRNVRGMAWVNGKIVYGSLDGTLRSVPFDPAAATAVSGASATTIAAGTAAATWSNPTLFFATS